MWQIENAVQIRVDRFTASSELDECGLFVPVTLFTLKSGDPAPNGLGAIRGPALDDLSVERRKVAISETNGYLGGHVSSTFAPSTNWYARGR